MKVKQYQPSFILSQFIESYIIFEEEINLKNKILNIIPNAKPEIAIHYGDPVLSYLNNPGEIKKGYLYGMHKKTGIFKATGSVKCLLVLFKSHGAFGIFGLPQIELRDRALDLELLCGTDGKNIIEQIIKAKNDYERIQFIERFLLKRLKMVKERKGDNSKIIKVLNLISYQKGCIKIKNLCFKYNINIKTLERNFKYKFGLTPKEFSRIVRLNSLYQIIYKNPYVNWQDAVYECNYYDQSHLINEFKEFTKIPPDLVVKNINDHMIFLNRIYSF
jgi:AraC-like DNA-binding protein